MTWRAPPDSRIVAWVLVPWHTRTPPVCTPRAATARVSQSPFASSPTAEYRLTSLPSTWAATAAFAPVPPGSRTACSAVIFSSAPPAGQAGRGSRR